jgi:tetratricopeptide (TPR) repeat protein
MSCSLLSGTSLASSLITRVDDACDRFEMAWRAGLRPRIEDYLGETRERERALLLQGLLVLDLAYRRRRGGRPTAAEYLARFSESPDLINAVVCEHAHSGLADSAATTGFAGSPPDWSDGDPDGTLGAASVPEWCGSDWPEVPGYDIQAVLGFGGMGVVFRARQRQLNRFVALKMIRAGIDARPGDRERFLVEAEAVARLHHANILQIYDFGEVAGLPFVALELLEGGRLADRLAGTPQPARQAAELMVTLARAIHAAHQAGIVHRDLKPSNVLFDRDGTPKIVDFGLAKRLEQEDGQTLSGQIVGTPSYMAPEQAQGRIKEVGPAADVYALGAILYELLTGRPPFKATTSMQTVMQVINDDPVPPSRLLPRVPRDLETICLKCLAKEPSRRYAGAQALADDLERYLSNQPIRARRTPLWERAVKWARRRPVAALLWVLGLASALALGGAGLYEHERAETVRVAILRREIDRALDEAHTELDQRQWDTAKGILTVLRPRLRDEPQLADRRTRIDDLLQQADQGVKVQQDYQHLLQCHKKVLFHANQLAGLDLPGSKEATLAFARKALAIFAAPGSSGSWTLAALPSSLFSANERARITEVYYELFLILAEVTDQPEDGLWFLDQAARLHPAPTQAYYLRQAACLAGRGDEEGAERARSAAARTNPSSALDHFLTGQVLYKRGHAAAARDHFTEALRLQPDHFWARYLSAFCCLQDNRPEEAVLQLDACIGRESDFAWLYMLRGYIRSLMILRRRDEAARRAGSQPNVPRSDFQPADADFRTAAQLLERQPDQELSYVLLLVRGLTEFKRGELARAVDDLHQAIVLNPHDFQALVVLAKVEEARGNPDAAIARYDQAIKAHLVAWAPLYRARADVHLGLKETTPAQRTLALRDLETAVALSPGDTVVARDHTNRARLLRQEGRDSEALDACTAALKIAPDHAPAHRLRLRILLDLKRDGEVLDSCTALLKQDQAAPELYELRALARSRRGDHAGAIEDDTTALRLRPDWTPLLLRRGWLHLTVGAPRLALPDFDEVIKRDPTSSEAYVGRGTAQVLLGDCRAAVADAETALHRGTLDNRLAYNAARIYAQAAQATAPDLKRRRRDAVGQEYEERAVELLIQAIHLTPPSDRREFWRNQINEDPALKSIVPRLKLRLRDPLLAPESNP